MVETILQVVVPITMFALMFGMGLTLTTADFKRVLVFPKSTLIGLSIQLLVMPSIGFALAYSFGLPTMIAVGLVAVAACPGGTLSNVVVHMGKGDTALSITLTAVATSVTLFTLPLWVSYSLNFFGGSETAVDIPILETAAQLALFTVLPVMLGMLVRYLHWALVAYEPIISKISTVSMIAAFIVAGLVDTDDILSRAGVVLIPSVLLVLIAVVIGYGVPRCAGINNKDSVTIAVETCLKNILLSLFIATNTLKDMEVAYASAVLGIIMTPTAIGIMLLFRRSRQRAGEKTSSVN
jgi:BASS family bile acid:Na+ symporter